MTTTPDTTPAINALEQLKISLDEMIVDVIATQKATQDAQQSAGECYGRLEEFVNKFAIQRVMQAVSNIDNACATIENNAIQNAGNAVKKSSKKS